MYKCIRSNERLRPTCEHTHTCMSILVSISNILLFIGKYILYI
jgi:hypothetical protein